ncbi:hypothetical protein KEH51_05020 [[Brevibacterium] frigoritolerans]|uniref:Uncharacterized protein n=1 Tax=Peribacillus frigoritolerans TaxID=450367 RepID=A0A941J9Y2_9BACI|nr:hypothetical protein [Peribacillus frigoritolerans]
MKKTKEELISYYERQLEKVISVYGNDWRKEDYIKCAKEDLEAVKAVVNGNEKYISIDNMLILYVPFRENCTVNIKDQN